MASSVDADFTLDLPWPAAELDSEESDDAPLVEAPRLPHELDELLGEFVDVLYGAGSDLPVASTSVDALSAIAEEETTMEPTLDGPSSLPPSSPASMSGSATHGWGGSEDMALHHSGSSSPVGGPAPPQPTFKRHLQQRSAAAAAQSPPHTSADEAAPIPTDAITDGSDIGPTSCWGALSKGHTVGCEPGFAIGKAHFKNKFCTHCRERIDMPLHKIRAMSPGLREAYTNPLSEGFWKRAPPTLGGGAFRLVNNTQSCIGPCLIIYQLSVPALPSGLEFAPMPQGWALGDVVPLAVAKGTLVPVLQMWKSQEEEARNRPKRRRQEKAGAAGSADADDAPPMPHVASGSFVDRLVDMHTQLESLLAARLDDAKRDGGTPMGVHQQEVVREQLAYSRAFLQTADTDQVAAWRSLGGLPPLINAALSPRGPAHSVPCTPAAISLSEHHGHPNGVAATTLSASKVLITSCDTEAVGGGAGGGRSLRPSDEAAASAGALRAAGDVECTLADSVPATALDGLMGGQAVWFFCGHADVSLHGRRTLAFAHPRGFELIDADTLVRMVGRHVDTLKLIVLNGCKSLHLALRLVDVGVAAVACWESLVNDEAAFWFGLGYSRSLASGKLPRAAFAAAVASLLVVTEPGSADHGHGAYVQKFDLADPEAAGADLRTGRLPLPLHLDGTVPPNGARGRVAAGVPWFICPLGVEQLRGVPALPPTYLPRRTLERQLLAALVEASAGRRAPPPLSASSSYMPTHPPFTPRADALAAAITAPAAAPPAPRASSPVPMTPRVAGTSCVALVGGIGRGKRLLATWASRDYRVQSLFRDGIAWLTLSWPAAASSSAAAVAPARSAVAQLGAWLGADVPSYGNGVLDAGRADAVAALRMALGRRRCLLILDGVADSIDSADAAADAAIILEACTAEQVVLVTTRSRSVATALGAACVPVTTLDDSHALTLFRQLLGESTPNAKGAPPAAQAAASKHHMALVASCGGEPLVLRVAAALAAGTDGLEAGALDLAGASRLLSTSSLATWPPLRGSPRYPHATVDAAYADATAGLPPATRRRWEQLGLVAKSHHGISVAGGGRAVRVSDLHTWWHADLAPTITSLMERGLVHATRAGVASRTPPSAACDCASATELAAGSIMLVVPFLAARFLEAHATHFPTARSRVRTLGEFCAARRAAEAGSGRGRLRRMLRSLLPRRSGRTSMAATPAGARQVAVHHDVHLETSITIAQQYAASVDGVEPHAAATRAAGGGVQSAGDDQEDGSLAEAAVTTAVAAAASVAPFCVSSAPVGWRGLGSLHTPPEEGPGAPGDGESDGGRTDATCDEGDDELTDATDEGGESPGRGTGQWGA